MWISLDEIKDEKYSEILGNQPQILKNFKYGDSVTVERKQIEDWLIVNTTTKQWEGGYLIKVLHDRK